MKKINVDGPVTMLDGKPIAISESDRSPFTIGKALANILISTKSKKFDSFKSYSLAKRFYNSSEVEVDESDFASILEIVKEDQSYGSLICGQILEVLNECK